MHDCLVVRSNCCRVVKDHDLSFELPDGLRLQLTIDEDHALTEVVPLELLFLHLGLDREADGLACEGLLNIHSLVVNALHLHRVELSSFVRAQEQRLVGNDGA